MPYFRCNNAWTFRYINSVVKFQGLGRVYVG